MDYLITTGKGAIHCPAGVTTVRIDGILRGIGFTDEWEHVQTVSGTGNCFVGNILG